MKTRSLVVATAASLTLACAAPLAVAHHGGGSYWDFESTIGPLTGTATEFSFTFPHVSIALDVGADDGTIANHVMSIRWTPTVLRNMGWSRRTIVPGDELTVTYRPHKQDPTIGSLLSLEINGEPIAISPEESP